MLNYQINPVLMGGKVKSISGEGVVKINLNGRLGVIKVPQNLFINNEELDVGKKLRFFFSYVKVVDNCLEFDNSDLNAEYGVEPTLLGGVFKEVNDTAVELSIMNGQGSVAVPRRWIFTEKELEENFNCELYLSCIEVLN